MDMSHDAKMEILKEIEDMMNKQSAMKFGGPKTISLEMKTAEPMAVEEDKMDSSGEGSDDMESDDEYLKEMLASRFGKK